VMLTPATDAKTFACSMIKISFRVSFTYYYFSV